jgi:hypothetical protein
VVYQNTRHHIPEAIILILKFIAARDKLFTCTSKIIDKNGREIDIDNNYLEHIKSNG